MFAGYEMPVQYPAGILAEHNQTRALAGLFDVSHMGQAPCAADDPAAGTGNPGPGRYLTGLAPGRMRYTQLLNDDGGILDDLIVANVGLIGQPVLVVNAACKDRRLRADRKTACPDD